MEATFDAIYKATGPTKSSIKVTAGSLPIKLHQMIVWIMHHQSDAEHLIQEYDLLRAKCEWRDASKINEHDFTPDEYMLQAAWLCLEDIGTLMMHDGVPVDPEHPKRIAITRCYEITNTIAKRLES